MGWCYVWAVIDVDTCELLMGFMAEESTMKTSWVLEACINKLSLSTMYPEALKAA